MLQKSLNISRYIIVIIAISLSFGCSTNMKNVDQLSEEAEVTKALKHLSEEAKLLIGKQSEEVKKLWGKPTGWSSITLGGIQQETWVYHFLKVGGEDILGEYTKVGETSSGEMTVTHAPYAPEVLRNYWIYNVYIKGGEVTKISLMNK